MVRDYAEFDSNYCASSIQWIPCIIVSILLYHDVFKKKEKRKVKVG